MRNLEFEDINAAQLYLIDALFNEGAEIRTRGAETLELSPVFFSVSNPRKRITSIEGRKWNFATALGELAWHLAASNDVSFISHYLSNWQQFSEDLTHINGSCYGHKIFHRNNLGKRKWDEIVTLLKQDPSTRRAIISLLEPSDELNVSKLDIPCTSSLQFLIRNNKLDLIVHMRSNDVIWGLPYDFFFFSFLQELMSVELGLSMGMYYHFAASLHIYERHFKLGRRVLSTGEYMNVEMPAISNASFEEFLCFEKSIRNKEIDFHGIESLSVESFWKDLLKVLLYYNLKSDFSSEDWKSITKTNYYEKIL